MVIILGKYTKPLTVIDALLADHRNFLEQLYAEYQYSKFVPLKCDECFSCFIK